MPRNSQERRAKRRLLMEKHKGKCYYCRRQMVLRLNVPNTCTVDHFVPKSYGGSNRKENLVAACYRCNCLKGDMMPWRFKDKYAGCELPEVYPLKGIENPNNRAARIARKKAEKKRRKEMIAGLPSNSKTKARAGFDAKTMGYIGSATSKMGDFWPHA